MSVVSKNGWPPQTGKASGRKVALSHIQSLFALICTEDYRDPQMRLQLPQDQVIWLTTMHTETEIQGQDPQTEFGVGIAMQH